MSSHESKSAPQTQKDAPTDPEREDRDRLRDIIVVIVTYPLTPTERTGELARKKPWLEFVSLLLKVALAAYALFEAMRSGWGR
ncbi:hypothetical protein QWY85_10520 [Neolewinella lacunae]|uniref:Uncharacterized protein n=1 Tax=Neolewinella lacunae TaxID=1517758 RepID=A0A923PPP2_9BACT|nr:hypothetical protein [Neolewinella lacunae]MBC6995506.1 hypothetical protein [Neolewinella lacunae]MDN3635094.1 hypothetical protein [Neolewinella lacunae]